MLCPALTSQCTRDVDGEEGVQGRIRIKGLDCLVCEERMRGLGLFGLGRLRARSCQKTQTEMQEVVFKYKKNLTERVVRHGNRLSRAAVVFLPLEVQPDWT